jgi:hypothetical protein
VNASGNNSMSVSLHDTSIKSCCAAESSRRRIEFNRIEIQEDYSIVGNRGCFSWKRTSKTYRKVQITLLRDSWHRRLLFLRRKVQGNLKIMKMKYAVRAGTEFFLEQSSCEIEAVNIAIMIIH